MHNLGIAGRAVVRRVTQDDVARAAGVHRATVSYVVSGRRSGGRISEPVARRVREAARSLGYVPNRQAQALVSGRTRVVGLLVQGLADDNLRVWSRPAEGAQDALFKAGHDVLLRIAGGQIPEAEAARTAVDVPTFFIPRASSGIARPPSDDRVVRPKNRRHP